MKNRLADSESRRGPAELCPGSGVMGKEPGQESNTHCTLYVTTYTHRRSFTFLPGGAPTGRP